MEEYRKELYKRIDQIVWEVWDPIGIHLADGPRDEYYVYLPSIFQAVLDSTTVDKLAEMLKDIEAKLGLEADYNKCVLVAKMLNSEGIRILSASNYPSDTGLTS